MGMECLKCLFKDGIALNVNKTKHKQDSLAAVGVVDADGPIKY